MTTEGCDDIQGVIYAAAHAAAASAAADAADSAAHAAAAAAEGEEDEGFAPAGARVPGGRGYTHSQAGGGSRLRVGASLVHSCYHTSTEKKYCTQRPDHRLYACEWRYILYRSDDSGNGRTSCRLYCTIL